MNGRAKTSCSSVTSRGLRKAARASASSRALAYTGPGREVFVPEASADPTPEPSAKQVPPMAGRRKEAGGSAPDDQRSSAAGNEPRAKNRAPTPTTRRAPTRAQASAKTGKRSTARSGCLLPTPPGRSRRPEAQPEPGGKAVHGRRRKR